MSLRAFHVLFIVLAGLSCVLLAAWSVARAREGSPDATWLGPLAAAAVVALAFYLRWFLRSWRRMSP